MDETNQEGAGLRSPDRRGFLVKAGRFAAVTPPALTLLLSTSLDSEAIAASGSVRGVRRGWKKRPKWARRGRGRKVGWRNR